MNNFNIPINAKVKSAYAKTTKFFKHSADQKIIRNFLGSSKSIGQGMENIYQGSRFRMRTPLRPTSNPLKKITRAGVRGGAKLGGAIRKLGLPGLILGGAVAMLSVGLMRGAMSQGRDIIYQRYMQDQMRSRGVLNNSRVGRMSGTSQMIDYGSTQGLSNALSRTRHGYR